MYYRIFFTIAISLLLFNTVVFADSPGIQIESTPYDCQQGGALGNRIVVDQYGGKTFNNTFDLADDGDASLKVYNLAGQLVETLVDGHVSMGRHNINWDASTYSSGIYFYRLRIADKSLTKRMTLLK